MTEHDHCIKGSFAELCSYQVANGKEVTCVAWDSTNEATLRLANGTRDRVVQLWSFNGLELHSSFSIKLLTTIPRAIAFSEGPGSDLYVFGVYNGNW